MVLRPPWLTRSVIRAPFKRLRLLAAGGGQAHPHRHGPGALRGRRSGGDDDGLALRPRIFAGTVPEILTLPARATLTLIGTPLAPASAVVVTFFGSVATGAPAAGAGRRRASGRRRARRRGQERGHVRAADRALRGGRRDHDRRRGERARVGGGRRRSRHLEALVVGPGDARRVRGQRGVLGDPARRQEAVHGERGRLIDALGRRPRRSCRSSASRRSTARARARRAARSPRVGPAQLESGARDVDPRREVGPVGRRPTSCTFDRRARVGDHAAAEQRRVLRPETSIGSSELLVTGRT